jgi:chromosome segregation ATPase
MKIAKLKKELAAARETHEKSSAAFKDISRRRTEAKKLVKEKKREFNDARRSYKTVRKTYRKLCDELNEIRREHLRNNDRIQKLSKKFGKGDVSLPKKKAPVKLKPKKRPSASKKTVNVALPQAAQPAITVVS